MLNRTSYEATSNHGRSSRTPFGTSGGEVAILDSFSHHLKLLRDCRNQPEGRLYRHLVTNGKCKFSGCTTALNQNIVQKGAFSAGHTLVHTKLKRTMLSGANLHEQPRPAPCRLRWNDLRYTSICQHCAARASDFTASWSTSKNYRLLVASVSLQHARYHCPAQVLMHLRSLTQSV